MKKQTRRNFLRNTGIGAAAWILSPSFQMDANPSFDLVIKDALIVDGTGGPPWKGDLGVTGDTIAAIGNISTEQGKRVWNANGSYVSPGFIDIHSHSDGSILGYPGAESRVMQGITSELTGNCGSSAAPLEGVGVQDRIKSWKDQEDIIADWKEVGSYFSKLEKQTISINQAILLGQGTLRENAIGNVDRILKPEELQQILRQVELGMDQGAFGISTGLEYTPGKYTPTDEIVEMSRIVARRGGLYASHIRSEDVMLLEAVSEAIEIGRITGVRVEVSHLKAAGKIYWPKQRGSLDLIESAHRSGIEVWADAYPYIAYSTGLTIFLEAWAREGGSDEIVKRLLDPEKRARIRKETLEKVPKEPGAYDLIVISSVLTEANRFAVGKNILQIAEIWKMEPVDALLRLIQEEQGSVSYVGFGMSPENVEMVLSHPLVMIGSDGSTMAPTGKAAESQPHPRNYGTYPRVLGYFCRERKLFDLPTAIKKMTSMPADQIGISDRGRIARGKKADLVLFDPAVIKDEASFESPHQYAKGISGVIVNGVTVVENGKHTGAHPGKVIRKA